MTPGDWQGFARVFRAGEVQLDGWQNPAAAPLSAALRAMGNECDQLAADAGEDTRPDHCRACGERLIPGAGEESGQWRTVLGRYFCAVSDDALHHPGQEA